MKRNPKIEKLGTTGASFITASGRELELRASDKRLYASLDLGGGDSSTVWRDGDQGAAEAEELRALLAAIEDGKKARRRLIEIARTQEILVLEWAADHHAA